MRFRILQAVVAGSIALGGCASSPNVSKVYDPKTDARLRVSLEITKFWKVYFNQQCAPKSYQPDLDKLDTAYRWDFSSDKKVGMPPGIASPYDEFIIKAGMPIVITAYAGLTTTNVNGFKREVFVDEWTAMTMQPGTDYEAYLNTYGDIVIRSISYVDGKLTTASPTVTTPPVCPKYEWPRVAQ
ncbi:hypothetical protein [Bordetella sp. LUAb4]|uniref:hypothetical protein n=1 Tax=Bordetella sp. LUAb4 TaxID=2843195 RepID=UPI001E5F0213|nr:hypothetical protein [Bordetella sp. LUAb4]